MPKRVKPGQSDDLVANSLAQSLPHLTQSIEHERIEVLNASKVKNDGADGGVANFLQESGSFLEKVGVTKAVKGLTQYDDQYVTGTFQGKIFVRLRSPRFQYVWLTEHDSSLPSRFQVASWS